MVDKALFIDAGAARGSLRQLEILSNNLANIGTIGFRADREIYKSIPITDKENESRVYSQLDNTFTDFSYGSVTGTGRDLDIAFSGPGFLTVQAKSGEEAYTREGDLQVKNHILVTHRGEVIKGQNGIVKIPGEASRVYISPRGAVMAEVPGQLGSVQIDQIKLSNPDVSKLTKGQDGLFYLPDGETAKYDPNVEVVPRSLEGSNVSPIKTLADIIELSRRFEFHTNLIKNFSDNASKANQLLSLE